MTPCMSAELDGGPPLARVRGARRERWAAYPPGAPHVGVPTSRAQRSTPPWLASASRRSPVEAGRKQNTQSQMYWSNALSSVFHWLLAQNTKDTPRWTHAVRLRVEKDETIHVAQRERETEKGEGKSWTSNYGASFSAALFFPSYYSAQN